MPWMKVLFVLVRIARGPATFGVTIGLVPDAGAYTSQVSPPFPIWRRMMFAPVTAAIGVNVPPIFKSVPVGNGRYALSESDSVAATESLRFTIAVSWMLEPLIDFGSSERSSMKSLLPSTPAWGGAIESAIVPSASVGELSPKGFAAPATVQSGASILSTSRPAERPSGKRPRPGRIAPATRIAAPAQAVDFGRAGSFGTEIVERTPSFVSGERGTVLYFA